MAAAYGREMVVVPAVKLASALGGCGVKKAPCSLRSLQYHLTEVVPVGIRMVDIQRDEGVRTTHSLQPCESRSM